MALGKFSSIITCTSFHRYCRIQSTSSHTRFSEQSAACTHVSPVARQQQAHLIRKRLSGDAPGLQSSCGMSVQHRTNLLTKWPCAATSILSPAEFDRSLRLRMRMKGGGKKTTCFPSSRLLGELKPVDNSHLVSNKWCVATFIFLFPGFSLLPEMCV